MKKIPKKYSKSIILICLALSGLCLIMLSFAEKDSSYGKGTYDSELTRYGEYLENKLSDTIEKLTGEGTVDIIITFDSSFEQVFKENSDLSDMGILSVSQKGESLPVKTKSPKIKGVMIVLTTVKTAEEFRILKKAAATVLDIPENKIYIIGGETANEKFS